MDCANLATGVRAERTLLFVRGATWTSTSRVRRAFGVAVLVPSAGRLPGRMRDDSGVCLAADEATALRTGIDMGCMTIEQLPEPRVTDDRSPGKPPLFFLVGSVRSGTTLLRLLLGHHPSICACEEMEYVAETVARHGTSPDMVAYRHALRLDRGFQATGFDIDDSMSFTELADSFMRQRWERDGRPVVGATVHNHFDALVRLWPDAKYIFLHRDPRDVARSCVQMGWVGTPWHGARFWVDAQEAWSRLSEAVPTERRLTLRFEDLVADTEATLATCCEFLDLEYDPAMLEIERDTTYRRPDPKAAKSWRTSASDREVAQVETVVGRQRLAAAGYEHSGLPELPVAGLGRWRIAVTDAVRRVRFRVRRYGLGLWAAGVASRRLPFQGWRERVQARIDAVDTQHLK